MCEHLGICRAAYYKWLKHPIPEKEKEDEQLAEIIREYDEKYGGILGYRRMRMFINRDFNKNYSIRRIRRIMKITGIHSQIRRVRHSCTVSNKADQKAENLLSRDFNAEAPNKKWTTDVTEFKIPGSNEKLYLSAFMDLYDRSIVAWVVRDHNDNLLVFDTLKQAIENNPDAHPMFHSDRGYQYTSPAFKRMLGEHQMVQSMSRVACCIDNGPTEALWGIIKTEMYAMYDIHDRESLLKAIASYIDFYNNHRYQERFDSKTPMEVRNEALGNDNPAQYPIAFNPRIAKYKESFNTQSA